MTWKNFILIPMFYNERVTSGIIMTIYVCAL
jgi:hypothetical protein